MSSSTLKTALQATQDEVYALRKLLADREARLREIRDTMRTHSARITVTSGTRYVLDLIKWHSDLRVSLPVWVKKPLPPLPRSKRKWVRPVAQKRR